MKVKQLAKGLVISSLICSGACQVSFAQNVLVTNGTPPPAGSTASGVTVNGSSISTGGINNNGSFSSNLNLGNVGTSVTQDSETVFTGAGLQYVSSNGISHRSAASTAVSWSEVSIGAYQSVGSATQYSGIDTTGNSSSMYASGMTGASYSGSSGYISATAGGTEMIAVQDVSHRFSPYAGLIVDASTLSNTLVGQTNSNGLVNTGALVNNGSIQATGNIAAGGTVTAASGMTANGRVQDVEAGVAPTDAVNVQQLQSATGAMQQTQQQLQQLNQQTSYNRRIASTGTAIAVAAASVPALEGSKHFGVGVGTGTYDGRSAISVAGEARVNRAIQVKFNIGTGSDGKVAAGAGALMSW